MVIRLRGSLLSRFTGASDARNRREIRRSRSATSECRADDKRARTRRIVRARERVVLFEETIVDTREDARGATCIRTRSLDEAGNRRDNAGGSKSLFFSRGLSNGGLTPAPHRTSTAKFLITSRLFLPGERRKKRLCERGRPNFSTCRAKKLLPRCPGRFRERARILLHPPVEMTKLVGCANVD